MNQKKDLLVLYGCRKFSWGWRSIPVSANVGWSVESCKFQLCQASKFAWHERLISAAKPWQRKSRLDAEFSTLDLRCFTQINVLDFCSRSVVRKFCGCVHISYTSLLREHAVRLESVYLLISAKPCTRTVFPLTLLLFRWYVNHKILLWG